MDVLTLLNLLAKQNASHEDRALIGRAYEFANRAHAGQRRKSGESAISHPIATAHKLVEMRLDAETIAAGLLHDVCEDTDTSLENIQKEFGGKIAFLVSGVTKLGKIKYRGLERSAESLRKMFLALAQDIRIVLIKLADRLHNMETLAFVAPEKQKRIAIETLEIYAPLAYRLGIGELKGRLEDLAFPYAYPDDYQRLMEQLKEHFPNRQAYIDRIKPIVADALRRERIGFSDIHARAKHHYSLYKKLAKYDMRTDQVFDLIALRIIVPSVEQCYAALGLLHKLWKPVPGLIKDYIALPKPNGYRSLHTTVFGPEGRTVEFQIRTPEMHEEAEGGIAAHWAYSEQKSTAAYQQRKTLFAPKKEVSWIRQLREWQKDFQSPEEFLEALKIDFFKSRIFVLTPKGDAIDLPEGSTPVDFAYHIHTAIGHAASGARVNDRIAPLDRTLENGDVVEILTQKNKKPSASWLSFVKSAGAHKRIAAFLRKNERTRWETR
ncbi:MAG: bifunctional (p)ppGpp synthetase/guanosine-3',5'-bis(diphosphate) 3'-pyrophosphohydrolase [Candidatus Sungbacteria bacterium]|nr:bifunctional (p)ppGpp synthetase/guanosine-3',5'-bis(diphosphate) 3'-pyrophosphohydrolase [Candidatus Sungbacteria bacterium]